jgi:hypothetical protein
MCCDTSFTVLAFAIMEKRYEGFLAPHGLYILDTFTGQVRFLAHGTSIPSASMAAFTELSTSSPENPSPRFFSL